MKDNEMKYLETKKGEKFPFIFSLNVMSTVQNKYGSLDEWKELIEPSDGSEPKIDALIFFFTEAINEGIDIENEDNNTNREFVTSKKVGRIITDFGLEEAGEKLKEAVVSASPKSEESTSEVTEKESDASKN